MAKKAKQDGEAAAAAILPEADGSYGVSDQGSYNIATVAVELPCEGFREIGLDLIVPSPLNPREDFNEAKLQELAGTIKSVGLAQPIVVRPVPSPGGNMTADFVFHIVVGERRWRACQIAGLETVPCIVKHYSDAEALTVAGIENLQREDLNPFEQAKWCKQMLDSGTAKDVPALATLVKKSARWTWVTLQMLKLGKKASELLRDGVIAAGHAHLLCRLEESDQEKVLAQCVVPEQAFNGSTHETVLTAKSTRVMDAWIKDNILLDLNDAPFSPIDPNLVKSAGACTSCEFRSGARESLFEGVGKDRCTKPECYREKCEAAVKLNALQPNLARKDKVASEEADDSSIPSEPLDESSQGGSQEHREESPAKTADDSDINDDDLTPDQAKVVQPDEGGAFTKLAAARIDLMNRIVKKSPGLLLPQLKCICAALAQRLVTPEQRILVLEAVGAASDNLDEYVNAQKNSVPLEKLIIALTVVRETNPNVELGLMNHMALACGEDDESVLRRGLTSKERVELDIAEARKLKPVNHKKLAAESKKVKCGPAKTGKTPHDKFIKERDEKIAAIKAANAKSKVKSKKITPKKRKK